MRAVLLISHGGVPTDLPRGLIKQLKAAEAAQREGGAEAEAAAARARRLDERVRNWPRSDATDPYRVGVEALAAALRPLLAGRLLSLAYNEFCAPSIAEALADLADRGVEQVLVVTTMMTPGGSHAETDIPHALQRARARHPQMPIDYAWPFDLDGVARMLADHIAGWPPLADTGGDGEPGP